MRVSLKDLRTFVPAIPDSTEELAAVFPELGFEATVVDRDTIELGITPNRGDAMSALGLARDLAAWLDRAKGTKLVVPTVSDTRLIDRLPVASSPVVRISDQSLVPVYEGIVVADVVVGPSPAWLATAVTKLGWRSISNVVDLTNYLMDCYGQPLHAFDLDAMLGQTMTVRLSEAGETLRTLDDVDRELPVGTLVIQDRDGLIDLMGIMGGANTEIHPGTKRVLLQAAALDRNVIRAATTALRLRTQAAIRYERGTDPLIARPVLNEAIRLIRRMKFGQVESRLPSIAHPAPRVAISVRPAAVNRLLGFAVSPPTQQRLLERLGCEVKRLRSAMTVYPPSWRGDLVLWQDIAEEIARLSGFNELLPATELPNSHPADDRSSIEWAEALKDRLIELGLSEVQTYSFLSRASLSAFDLPTVGELANPLNPTLRYLRPSLVPNLAAVAASNQLFDPVAIFEIGHVFTLQREEVRLGVGLVGRIESASVWLARLSDQLGIDSGQLIESAIVTELTDQQRSALKIRKGRAIFIEVPLAALASARRIPAQYALAVGTVQYRPVSRFPAVSRDIAIVLSIDQLPETVRQFIRSYDRWIEAVDCFDEYQSDKLGIGRKSLAFHIRYADPDRTLTEDEVNALHERLVASLKATFDATIR